MRRDRSRSVIYRVRSYAPKNINCSGSEAGRIISSCTRGEKKEKKHSYLRRQLPKPQDNVRDRIEYMESQKSQSHCVDEKEKKRKWKKKGEKEKLVGAGGPSFPNLDNFRSRLCPHHHQLLYVHLPPIILFASNADSVPSSLSTHPSQCHSFSVASPRCPRR